MKSIFRSIFTVAAFLIFAVAAARAQVYTTLFSDDSSGNNPVGALLAGNDSNFYGITSKGGTGNAGTVFKVTPAGVLTRLVSFGTSNGADPNTLLAGRDGNFYGTTLLGGASGLGTVFRMTPAGELTTLLSFDSNNGSSPSSLVEGKDGNFYGTTSTGGGNLQNGTIFKMTPAGALTTLKSFTAGTNTSPNGSPRTLVEGSDGNFYGTRAGGAGAYSGDTVFKITPAGELTTVVEFGNFGGYPTALLAGHDGNFYGRGYTVVGSNSYVFKVTPAGVLTRLYTFQDVDGAHQPSGLVEGGDGSFYGVTQEGGVNNLGTAFKVTPAGVLTTLHSFDGKPATSPQSAPVFGSNGSLYGTANNLVVWRISLDLPPAVTTGAASGLTVSTATLAGTVVANGGAATVDFEYGLTASYGQSVPAAPSLVSGTSVTAVSAALSGLQAGTTYHFRVAATSAAGSSLGSDATFTTAFPVFPNNSFANAQILTGSSGLIEGGNFGATKEAGEPDNANGTGGASVWYQWTAPATGLVKFDTLTSSFDTLLAVYTGSAVGGLTAVPGGVLPSTITFNAVAGTVYSLSVNGRNAAEGFIALRYSFVGVNNAPQGANKTVTIPEATAYTLSVADFGFSDPIDLPAHTLAAVKLTTLPAAGTLANSEAALAAGAWLSLADIAAGNIKFIPADKANGAAYASFTFQVQDNGGTANDGIDLDPSPNTITINVTTFSKAVGLYDGLARAPIGAAAAHERAGLIRVKILENGAMSGKLVLGGASFAFKGSVDNAGVAHFGSAKAPAFTLARRGLPSLTLALRADVSHGNGTLSGAITNGDGSEFAVIEADRAAFSNESAQFVMPAGLPGKYTVIFAAKTPAEQGRAAGEFPQGDGFGLVTLTPSGVVKLAGTLADGTKVSFSNAISAKQTWPLYIPLFGGKGSISGPVVFRERVENSDLDGLDLHWFKPAGQKAKRYPAGWPGSGIRADLVGAKLLIPSVLENQSVLTGLGLSSPAGNALLSFAGGTGQAINVDSKNKVSIVAANAGPMGVVISPATGSFSGHFLDAASKKVITFKGAILQTQHRGSGFFLDSSESGAVLFEPK